MQAVQLVVAEQVLQNEAVASQAVHAEADESVFYAGEPKPAGQADAT